MIAALLALVGVALGGELRVGVFVGNNFGAASDPQLVFAATDARKMRDAFVEYGGVTAGDATLLIDQPRHEVVAALQAVHKRIVDARNAGDHTTLLFYYSGHGDADGLHLGVTRLPHEQLRSLLEDAGADVRVAMLDACQSGGAVRAKGGQRGPTHAFALDTTAARGTVFLTSSAASELSQESAEVGGGFFTHYLHTALLGAADADRDGRVTLAEAYVYVHSETVFGTQTTSRAQTPSFDFDLVGAGDLTLTELERTTARLNLLGDLEGTYAVWDAERRRYVAELDGARAAQIGVRPGAYYLHRRMPGWVDEARYEVRRGEVRTVAAEDFVSVPYEQSVARGHLERVARRARLPARSFRVRIGRRTFGEHSLVGRRYVPAHGVLGLELRLQSSASPTWTAFDLVAGGGPGLLRFDERGDVPVLIQSYAAGAAFGFATRPRLIRAGIGGRAELIGFVRSFEDGVGPTQRSLTVAPGMQAWVGLHHGRVSLELQQDLMWMALAFTDAQRHPLYGGTFVTGGVRF